MLRSSTAKAARAPRTATNIAFPLVGSRQSGLNRTAMADSFFEPLESRTLMSVNVTTYHYDNSRDGANTNETALTLANVNKSTFGKVASFPVDAQVYAQPLVMTGVAMGNGQGTHDIVLVATENDTVYAFDAQGNNPAQGYLWKTSLLQAGETSVPQTDYASNDITPLIGITGTPVIDPSTNIMYVVGAFKQPAAGTYSQRIYAINIATGTNAVSPVTIAASVPGTGYANVNGVLTFSPFWENQRPGLTLTNGEVYVAWSAHGDANPWHGWVIGFNASTLRQDVVYCDTPNGDAGGIWMSGGGLAVDSAGNLYFTTGNGDFNANTAANLSSANLSMAIVKLTPTVAGTTTTLTVSDYFAPYNQAALSDEDADYGCSSVVLLPTQTGGVPNEAVTESKWGGLFLNDTDTGSLGEFNANGSGPNNDLGETTINGRMHNTISYWNGHVYIGGDNQQIKSFNVSGGTLATTPWSVSTNSFGNTGNEDGQGCGPTVSSNGSSNGILWALDDSGFNANPAVLYAYNASNVGQMLYSSSQAANNRDAAAGAVKFVDAVVANGYVYVGGAGAVTVYGLINASTATPTLVTPAAASPTTVVGTTTNLSVTGSDPAADMRPVYTWSATTVPAGAAAPTFSYNATNAANNTTATFYAAGNYTFTATITDPNSGLTVTSTVNVTVNQTLTGVAVTPAATTIYDGTSQQLTAASVDQFGNAMATQPGFNWTVAAGGAGGFVTSTGLYTAPAAGTGTDVVTATSGTLSSSSTISVVVTSSTIPVNLAAYDNRAGIVLDGNTFAYGLDGGSALSGNLLGTSQTYNGSAFTIPAAVASNNVNNVVFCNGQTITLSQNRYSAIKLLATTVNGNQAGVVFTVNYTDGTSQTITQGFSDWFSPQGYAGESIAVNMPYRDQANGTEDNRTFYVYGYNLAVNAAKTVASISLPAVNFINIVAIDVTGVASTSVPTVTTPAAASPATSSGTTTVLSVLGTDPAADLAPTYTWSTGNAPSGAKTPTFSANGTGSANSSTVTFYQAGSYTLTATITDPSSGLSNTSSVNVTVAQTLSGITVTPATATVPDGATRQLTAAGVDQFGNTLTTTPTVTWSVLPGGLGSVGPTGLYQAPATGAGSATVQASSGGFSAQSTVAISNVGTATFYPVQAGWYRAGVWQGTSGSDGGTGFTSPAGNTVLIAKNPAGGTLRDPYLLYNISNASFGGTTITSVTLTFSAAAINQAGPVALGVYAVTNTSWGSTTVDPAPAPNYTGATEIGTTQNVGGVQGNYASYTFSLAGGITAATNGLITLELNSPAATNQETGIEIDNLLNTPGVDPVITINYSATQPAWLASGSFATFNSTTKVLTVTGAASIIADPGTDEPIIQANGSSAVVTINPASGTQIHIGALDLFNGASAAVTAVGAAGVNVTPRVLIIGQTSSAVTPVVIDGTSKLNLTDNDLDIVGGSLATASALVGKGYSLGTWAGTNGITSSTAAGDTTHLTGVGVIQNNGSGTALFSSTSLFDGTAPGASDILVKYTYAADANLDGQVDGSDYSLIDAGYTADVSRHGSVTGWVNGDFNYDGTIDGSDYALIDNAFNNQGLSLSTIVNFANGFAGAGSSIVYNGNAVLNGTQLQITPNTANQAGSAYFATPINLGAFHTRFTFVTTAGNTADGFTFTMQNAGATALGAGGGALGYQGIANSVAVKFDLYNNNGEGGDSTGLYVNGAIPQNVGSVDLTNTGINFHSGDTFQADITYSGTTLIVLITDTATGATATQTYTVNLESTIGSSTAYFGFTGGTGGLTSQQSINTWTVVSGA